MMWAKAQDTTKNNGKGGEIIYSERIWHVREVMHCNRLKYLFAFVQISSLATTCVGQPLLTFWSYPEQRCLPW